MTPAVARHIPGHVLLVEDEPAIALNIEMMLEYMGVGKTDIARSTEAAERRIDSERYDLAILDVQLGDEMSLPIAARLCRAKVPVILSSGHCDLVLPKDCAAAHILTKPFTTHQLERAVLEACAVRPAD